MELHHVFSTRIKHGTPPRAVSSQVRAEFKAESGPVPKRVLKAKSISSKTANSYKFDFAPRGKPDAVENISVAEYYFRTYGVRLRFPNMPLLTSGGGKREIAVPIELFSIVPGTLYPFGIHTLLYY